jgi:radical SAM-linked protein
MDIELTESVNTSDLINRINENIPLGLKIIEAKKLTESDKSFNKIDSAKYIVHTQGNGCREIEKLLEMESIEVEKKTKKGISNVDIRKDIRNIEYIGLEDEYDVFIMHLSAGSNSNLKPETVLKEMELYLGYKTEFYKVKRISMYFENSINIF